MAWLRLIRWSNLLIILLTQGAVWWCIIYPLRRSVPLLLTPLNFFCLSLSTVLIAAAGYVINDYFDVRIDAINKPGEVVLGQAIPRRLGILSHLILNGLALVLAAYVAGQGGHYEWVGVQTGCMALLWFYSTHFKRRFVIGNFVVALMTAMTIVVLFIYEPELYAPRPLQDLVMNNRASFAASPVGVICVFTGFAFLMTWMREVVKDMEDLKGDLEEGCDTMPIRWGLLRSSRFVQWLGVLTVMAMCYSVFCLWQLHFRIVAAIAVLVLLLPLCLWILQLPKGASIAHYARASRRLKLLMVGGILCLFLIYLRNFHLSSV